MSIEAIGAVSQASNSTSLASAQPSTTTTSQATGTEVSVKPTTTSGVHQPSFLEKASSEIYGTVDDVGVSLPGVEDSVTTAINRAKEQLQPSSDLIAPGTKPASPEGNEALVALNKTFDHAVFMAMVNQVISGVSDTSRTMIKQQ